MVARSPKYIDTKTLMQKLLTQSGAPGSLSYWYGVRYVVCALLVDTPFSRESPIEGVHLHPNVVRSSNTPPAPRYDICNKVTVTDQTSNEFTLAGNQFLWGFTPYRRD